MDKIELPSILVAKFWLILRKIMSQLLLILNNIFSFRLHNTVSIATTTPPKHIPAFDKKSSFVFDIQAASRRKHDQKIPAIFKTWKEWATAHQENSREFYQSSESSESWLENLRTTQLAIRWSLICDIQWCVR